MNRNQNAPAFVVLLVVGLFVSGRAETEVRLSNDQLSVWCNPATLEMRLQSKAQPLLILSEAQSQPAEVAGLRQDQTRATWRLPNASTTVSLHLDDKRLSVAFRSDKPGLFSWPVLPGTPPIKAWVLPMFEGVFVPADDARWISFLEKHGPLNTTADLGLPFWGWDCGDFTVTWIATNPFNNELTFTNHAGRLAAGFQHDFTRNNPVKEFGFMIQIGKASAIEPAIIYRRWLQERGGFVSLKDKIKRTPEAEKLLGAAHAYLWGDEVLTADDVKDWKAFGEALKTAGESASLTPAKQIWSALKPDVQKIIAGFDQAERIDLYTKSVVVDELNRLLTQPDLDHAGRPPLTPSLSASDGERLAEGRVRGSGDLTEAEICRRNSRFLADALPGLLAPPENWGDGISPKMISQLATAGFDRLCLNAPGWEGFVRRPETVEAAKQRGYLIGTYDSYDSVHSPKASDDTWATAQFDQQLFDTGAVVLADGRKKSGFKQKGFHLSPTAARPYVEKRVNGLMKIFHANSWFVDCDGFGDYFDDYSPAHPATQQSDLQARCSRMAWIRDTFGAVIGTEGCSAGVAGTVHYAHGVMTPVIGWGDPDLTSKSSKYFLGAWYPPNRPAVFFKPVPTKEEYRYIYFDPRFRLPLFETVFHDSVVATHHWTAPSGKFSDQAQTVALLELLYQVPPLYHLNLEEFQKRKVPMKRHYDFFSPLHRETGLLPLTEFEWLTADRLVQRTLFGDSMELVANFRETTLSPSDGERDGVRGASIPPRSILARHRATGKIVIFTPEKSR